jgi:DNA-directed RNA polymerase specialized sigma24 family protein
MEFPDTCWIQLAAATLHGGAEERAALEALCQRYYPVVLGTIRAKGLPPERAEDLTQGFFLHLLERGAFRRADPLKGKFRSFLLGSLRFFLSHDAEKNRTQRRGGHFEIIELQEGAASTVDDDLKFDHEWALNIMEMALAQVRELITATRGESVWSVLKNFLPGGQEPPAYETAAEMMGLSLSAMKSDIFRLRHRFREALRAEIARTVSAPHEIDEELAHLRAALASYLG